MSTGPEELNLETISPEDADLIDLRYEGVDLPLDENADPTQVDLACGEHLGVVSLEGGYDDESFVDLHVLGEVFRGESAYDAAVRNGFVGTLAQWLESLRGEESPNAAIALAAQAAAEEAADRAEAATLGASDSETSAAGHASAATTARGQAEAYRDEAGVHAQASLTFRTSAETASGQALAYRNQAAQSSSDADSAALRAETAEGVSVTMRNQAQGFSEASAASSQSAETYMDESRVEAQAARDAHLLAETSRENSLAHSLASYDSAQEAIARSTEAGEYASAALTSRLAAEAARDDTDVAAAAVIIDRDIVIARADEAGEYAEAAESHRASALTSAGAASVSASNSAISETNADSSRVAAEAARDIAVASSGDAADALAATISYRDQAEIFSDQSGDYATAAASSATSASTSATAAGTSATGAGASAAAALASSNASATSASNALTQAAAALTSANNAATSATNSTNQATNSAASATAAANSQAAAALSASAAISAEADAIIAQGAAQTAATNAATQATAAALSATNALSSANSAATSATQSSSSATTAAGHASNASISAGAAATSATNAQNSSTAAAGSASTAATQATNAGNSATAANASSVSAASSFNASNILAAMQLPDRYDGSSGQFFSASATGSPATRTDLASNATASGFGPVREETVAAGGNAVVAPRGVIPAIVGRIYKVEVEYQRTAISGTADGNTFGRIELRSLDSAYADTAGSGANLQSSAFTGSVQTASVMISNTSSAGVTAWPAGAVWLRPYFRAYAGAATSITVQFRRITVTDVTEQQAALSSANAAATSASAASTSAGSAGTSATAANTSATNAATSAGSASTSATSASNSATTATSAANTATTQAGLAATSALNAGNSATAANTSAGTAATHATNAGNSATAANSSAVNAASSFSNTVISGGNTGFEDGVTGWAQAWDTGDGAIPYTSHNASFQSRGSVLVGVMGASVGARALKKYPFISGRKYRFRASVWNGGTGTSANYFGIRCLQADGSPAGSNNGHRYFTGASPINSAGGSGWLDYASPVLLDADFNANTTHFQIFTLLNNSGVGTIQSAIDRIWVEDITESEAAASSATAAATSASSASTSATAAGNSATSAAASSVSAASSYGAARLTAASTMPSDFSQSGEVWFNGFSGAPSAQTPIGTGSVFSFPTVSGIGKVIQIATAGTNRDVGSVGAMAFLPNRTYRITVRGRVLSTIVGSPTFELYFCGLDANYTAITTPGTGTLTLVADTWTTLTLTRTSAEILALNANVAFLRPLARAAGASGSNTFQFSSVLLEDITESAAAANSAAAATTSASSASTSATNAGNSATAANSSAVSAASSYTAARNTVAGTFPPNPDATGTMFTEAFEGTPAAVGLPTPARLVSYAGAFAYQYPNNVTLLSTRGVVPATTGRTYEVRAEVLQTVAGGNASQARLVMRCLNGSHLNVGVPAAVAPWISTPEGTVTTLTYRFAASATTGTTAWTAGSVWLRAYVQANYKVSDTTANTAGTAQIISLTVEDVTEVVAAETSATAAATSASSASTSATNAGTSATAASTSATNASTSAGQAGTSATNAANSATTATTQANNAATSASTAATHATNAGNSASAAGTSATTAGTHATNAGNSATAANTSAVNAASSYTNTVVSGGNQDFADGLTGWSWDTARTAPLSGFSPSKVTYQASFQGRPNVVQQTTGQNAYIYSNRLWTVQTGRTYRIRSSVWIGAVAPTMTYIGMRALDSAGVEVTGNGGHIYNVAGGVQLATNQWHDLVSASFTVASVNAGLRNIQLLAFLNYGVTAGASSALDGIWLEDITESVSAGNSATAAATSASNAATSATNAGTSATAAATSATNASTSAGSAGTSATNAANSATTATTQANNAATSASTAATHATNAGNSASAAGTSATTAGTHATNAGNSATTATTQANNAASSYTATRDRTASVFPEVISADTFSTVWTGSPASVSNITVTNDASFGPVYQTGAAAVLATRGVVQAIAGRVYEVRAVLHWATVPGGQTPVAAIGIRSLDAAYANIGGAEAPSASGGYSTGTNGTVVTLTRRFGSTAPSGGTGWNSPGSAIWLRPYITMNGSVTSIARVRSLTIVDVTALVASEAQATAAATSASNASTSATNAGTSATAANSSAVSAASSFTNTVIVEGNTNFASGTTGWTITNGGSVSSSIGGRSGVFTHTTSGAASDCYTLKKFPIDPARKYKIKGSYWTGAGGAGSQLYIGFRAYNSAGAAITHNPGSYAYVAVSGTVQAPNAGWVDYTSAVIVAEVPGVAYGFPVGTASIELLCLGNYNGGTTPWGLDSITLLDVTEAEAAATSATAASTSASSAATSATNAGTSATAANTSATNAATSASSAGTFATNSSNSATAASGSASTAASSASTAGTHATTASNAATTATTQASNASSSAASAASSATLAASVSVQSYGRNPRFSSYPTTPGIPTDWSNWTNATGSVRVAGETGGYGVTIVGGAGTEGGIVQTTDAGSISQNQYYVIEADVKLNSGSLTGAGALTYVADAAGNAVQTDLMMTFSTTPDSTGVAPGAGVVGQTYRFRKLVRATHASTSRLIIYAMSHWSTHGSIAAANSLTWYLCSARPATPAEISAGVALPALQASVTTTQTAVANLQTQNALARYEVSADTGGGTARLRLVSTTYGTNVLLDADKIFWGDNTVFDNAVDVLVTTTAGVAKIIALGAPFGTDGSLTQWEGPSSITWGNHSRANAHHYTANAAPYSGGSRRLVRTDLVETDAITKEYRSDSPNADNYNTVGPITARTTVHYITIPTTGKKISFNAQFLLQAHHSQDNYTFYVVVERLLNGVTTDVFSSNIKCLTTNGDGYIHGWQMINFTDTPAAQASVQYSIRVYHTYSIGGPGNFTNYIVSHKSISIREHRTE